MTSPNDPRMPHTPRMSQRAVPPAVFWYVIDRMKAWEEEGILRSRMAERLGVNPATVTDIFAKLRGVGYKTATGMAEALGMEWSDFQKQAEAEYAARGKGTHTDPLVRYPNLIKVLELFAYLYDPDTVALAKGEAFKSDSDLLPDEWQKELEALDARVRRQKRMGPELLEAERKKQRRENDELLRKEAIARAKRQAEGTPETREDEGKGTGKKR